MDAPIDLLTCPLHEFAHAVHDAASRAGHSRADRLGEKVLISAIAPSLALPLEDLRRRLVDAHRAGLLELRRADLVAAYDRAAVAASEFVAETSEFHCVVDTSYRHPWDVDAAG